MVELTSTSRLLPDEERASSSHTWPDEEEPIEQGPELPRTFLLYAVCIIVVLATFFFIALTEDESSWKGFLTGICCFSLLLIWLMRTLIHNHVECFSYQSLDPSCTVNSCAWFHNIVNFFKAKFGPAPPLPSPPPLPPSPPPPPPSPPPPPDKPPHFELLSRMELLQTQVLIYPRLMFLRNSLKSL